MKCYSINDWLDAAQKRADNLSTCAKVQVGCVITDKDGEDLVWGWNKGIERNCREEGCHRIELYGEDSKNHRLPSDCVALHSEINAIATAARFGISLYESSIYITRYPCEACARAIIRAGIKEVIYGRRESVSPMTQRMFDEAGVQTIHAAWNAEDNNS